MENKCNKGNITSFFIMDKRLDLSSKVNRDSNYSIFRLYLTEFEMQFLEINSKHFIDGKKYKIKTINYIQIDEKGMYDCYVIFKNLNN